MLQLDKQHEQEIHQIAGAAYPNECCGFLIGRAGEESRTVEVVKAVDNQRTDSLHNRYLIGPEEIRDIEQELRGSDRQIIGFFHSHPDVAAQPSKFDLEHAWPWYSYLIVSVIQGSPRQALCWRMKADRSAFEREELRIMSKSGLKVI